MDKTFFITTDDIQKSAKSSDKTLRIAGYANTTSKDRSGDIVLPEAWAKGVENFRRNPILLYQLDNLTLLLSHLSPHKLLKSADVLPHLVSAKAGLKQTLIRVKILVLV